MDDLALPSAGLPDGTGDACLFGPSLCSGAGGLDLGLAIAIPGYRAVGHVERETYAAATLVARMEDASLDKAVVWDDVATFDGRPWRGAVDIVTAGYPCQPFSVAGKRRGADDPRHLWPHVARIIGEVAPPFVFLENVAHHLRLGFPEVAGGLVGMGYRLAAGLFTAAEVGAPHKRERLFILAIREGDELADPARLLRHPLEWREPDGTAAALADAEGQCERKPADETDALAGSGPARDEPCDHGRDVADTAKAAENPPRAAEASTRSQDQKDPTAKVTERAAPPQTSASTNPEPKHKLAEKTESSAGSSEPVELRLFADVKFFLADKN
ncbi:DNA cytosine methyltransferase [Pseudooceanicola pacificus]|uniref:DNA cytosine methyltransferase n=1 Tax=Pseudooceanicola pacificus TaxID=2676438 RepID=UPI001F189B18|nr:DNA cytosine methyltransferase [Pseudooceanicola pacificus]